MVNISDPESPHYEPKLPWEITLLVFVPAIMMACLVASTVLTALWFYIYVEFFADIQVKAKATVGRIVDKLGYDLRTIIICQYSIQQTEISCITMRFKSEIEKEVLALPNFWSRTELVMETRNLVKEAMLFQDGFDFKAASPHRHRLAKTVERAIENGLRGLHTNIWLMDREEEDGDVEDILDWNLDWELVTANGCAVIWPVN